MNILSTTNKKKMDFVGSLGFILCMIGILLPKSKFTLSPHVSDWVIIVSGLFTLPALVYWVIYYFSSIRHEKGKLYLSLSYAMIMAGLLGKWVGRVSTFTPLSTIGEIAMWLGLVALLPSGIMMIRDLRKLSD